LILHSVFYLAILHALPSSTLFPYTTLFRSQASPSLGVQWSFNTQSLGDNTALLWTASGASPAPSISVTPSSRTFGNVPVGSSEEDRKSTRLNSSHVSISYAVFCLKKKKEQD